MMRGISDAVGVAFPDIIIYMDDQEQEFKEPSFYISLLESSIRPLPSERYNLACTFLIDYFPTPRNESSEISAVAFGLYDALEVITISGSSRIRGLKLRHTSNDDILHFFMECNVNLMSSEVTELMGELTIMGGVKNE